MHGAAPSWPMRVTRTLLWVSVFAWGTLLGAKIFDLVVLAGAWGASPPQSLRLLPYSDDYPVDTGEFFIPSSAALLVATSGALAAGWRTPWRFRALLAISAGSILATLVLTVLVFWPLNSALWGYAIGSPGAVHTEAEIIAMTAKWIALDWVRVAVAGVGYLAAIRALSLPYPGERAPKDPLWVKVGLIFLLLGVAGFVVYFVSNI